MSDERLEEFFRERRRRRDRLEQARHELHRLESMNPEESEREAKSAGFRTGEEWLWVTIERVRAEISELQ